MGEVQDLPRTDSGAGEIRGPSNGGRLAGQEKCDLDRWLEVGGRQSGAAVPWCEEAHICTITWAGADTGLTYHFIHKPISWTGRTFHLEEKKKSMARSSMRSTKR